VEDMIEGRIMIERELAEEKIEKAEKQVQKAREEKYETAKNMFNKGINLDTIIECFKFSQKEIEKLKLML